MYSQADLYGRWCDLATDRLLGLILTQSKSRASCDRNLLYILDILTVVTTATSPHFPADSTLALISTKCSLKLTATGSDIE
ncbi:hypothetical protein [Chamaesiphon sp.]|uniref:hypothetical protein n=1 Tax=Chamaesiphon sp. TaxID=2814140 RepID=UPI0035934FFB